MLNHIVNHIVFFIYIFALFFCLCAIALIVIVSKYGEMKSSILKTMLLFSIVCLMFIILYLLYYYRDMLLGIETANVFLRILDAVIYVGIITVWIEMIKCFMAERMPGPIISVAKIVIICCFLLDLFVTIELMDSMYNIPGNTQRVIGVFVNFIYNTSFCILILIFMWKGAQKVYHSFIRFFIIFQGVCLTVFYVNNFFIEMILYYNRHDFLYVGRNNLNAIVMVALNVSIIILINHMGIKSLITKNRMDINLSESKEFSMVLNALAEKYKLTIREKDVLELVYRGYNNPKIAEQLYISRSTVKLHLHHIYEKLNVTNRIDLILLINSKISK